MCQESLGGSEKEKDHQDLTRRVRSAELPVGSPIPNVFQATTKLGFQPEKGDVQNYRYCFHVFLAHSSFCMYQGQLGKKTVQVKLLLTLCKY